MISSTITLALLLSQFVAAAPAQTIGSVNTIVAAWQDRANRTITFNTNHTRVCVGPASGSTLTGRTTIRFGAILLEASTQQALTMPLESGQTDYREQYAAAEVQIDPNQPPDHYIIDVKIVNAILDVIAQEVEVRASPLVATAEICLVRRDAPEITSSNLYRCACRVDSTCLVGGVAAPVGRTLSPGTFSGTGCKLKPCFTRFDGIGIDNSWPTECPK